MASVLGGVHVAGRTLAVWRQCGARRDRTRDKPRSIVTETQRRRPKARREAEAFDDGREAQGEKEHAATHYENEDGTGRSLRNTARHLGCTPNDV